MSRLNSKVGQSSDYVQMLPEVVKRRIRALKNLQHEAIIEQANFFNEVHELEVKCHQKNLPLYERRQKIVNGFYEPLEAEMQEKLDKENENLSKELKAKAKTAEREKNEEIFPEDVKGIPKFWLTVLKNVYIFKNIIQAIEELNIKSRTWKDLLTDDSFVRSDIITLQDPHNLGKFNISNFHHMRKNLNHENEELKKAEYDPAARIKMVPFESTRMKKALGSFN
ncbi:nucleosome assembly protein 1-like 1-B [Artemia franciscana]|uniref:nucleosome assembly protein 1-like 1-B n=1 Tax=Artemia franciscana TaxID=6661 RepID=UPI0032DBC0A5